MGNPDQRRRVAPSTTTATRPRASGYYEADLGAMLESGDEAGLRLFHLLFRRSSFTPQNGAVASFLETALAEGRRYEAKVAQDLSSVVFESVFPALVRALADATGEALPQVRQAALIFLYRPALRPLRRGQGTAPRKRPPLRGLRLAEAGPPGHRPPDRAGRRLLRRLHPLLRPPYDAVPSHRQGRSFHRPSALQRRPVRRRGRSAAR